MSDVRTLCLLVLFFFVLFACTKEEEDILPEPSMEHIVHGDSMQLDTLKNCVIDTTLILCTSGNEDTIRIRMSNVSTFMLENIVVNFVGDEVFYGSLDTSEFSVYGCYAHAWSSALVELTVACDTLTFQPIDFLGERVLEDGRFTFELDVADEGSRYDRIQLNVVDDE